LKLLKGYNINVEINPVKREKNGMVSLYPGLWPTPMRRRRTVTDHMNEYRALQENWLKG